MGCDSRRIFLKLRLLSGSESPVAAVSPAAARVPRRAGCRRPGRRLLPASSAIGPIQQCQAMIIQVAVTVGPIPKGLGPTPRNLGPITIILRNLPVMTHTNFEGGSLAGLGSIPRGLQLWRRSQFEERAVEPIQVPRSLGRIPLRLARNPPA